MAKKEFKNQKEYKNYLKKEAKKFTLTSEDLGNLFEVCCMVNWRDYKTLELNKIDKWFEKFFGRIEKIILIDLYKKKLKFKIKKKQEKMKERKRKMKKSIIKESWEDYKGMFISFKNVWNFKELFKFDFVGLFKGMLFILVCVAFPMISMWAIIYGSLKFSLWLLLSFPLIIFIDIMIITYFSRLNDKWRFI